MGGVAWLFLFRYSPLDILSVYLPPLIIDFSGHKMQDWLRSEAISIMSGLNSLHLEVRNIIQKLELKIAKSISEPIKDIIHRHILQLKDVLKRESDDYSVLLKPAFAENNQLSEGYVDILELSRLKRSLLIDSILWDHRLCLVDSLSKSRSSTAKVHPQVPGESTIVSPTQVLFESIFSDDELYNQLEESTVRSWTLSEDWSSTSPEEFGMQEVESNCSTEFSEVCVSSAGRSVVSGQCLGEHIKQVSCEENTAALSSESLSTAVSTLYDRIDSAWTGTRESLTQHLNGNAETGSVGQHSLTRRQHYRKLLSPVRVSSFDSALRFRNNVHQRLSPLSLRLSSVKSFASRAYLGSESNPITRQAYIKRSLSMKRLNFLASHKLVFISSISCVACKGARLLIPQGGPVDVVIALYDHEPTSIIAYAVCSQEHANFIDRKADQREAAYGDQNVTIAASRTSTSQVHSDDIRPWCYGSDDSKPFNGGSNANQKELHFKFSYVDDYSIPGDKVKFSVICYFAKQFDALRRKCCPNNLDFIRSLSRCKKWNAQGGKSNVYFAKSWDERFIVKQVTRTELESFEDFGPEYFNYLSQSIKSGSPTCLAKVLGIYQVTVKHLKGGREMKMDLMVMENLFYERNVSRIYDLKGSSWARYIADTSGSNKVLLDLNLLETLRTRPIFLGSKAKRKLERAIWNDTSLLAEWRLVEISGPMGTHACGVNVGCLIYLAQKKLKL
ncbi:hypothetical protein HPP92_023169 [Vanilla planifolia]|uniref:PIPK domain-containing protein n=1 Tax=Vanilla planifolia TaxID=51239 RepID=A0A835PTG4_VANPL|nr:hypothetical protein HPP92_023169 [Vanilla planifolia]